MNSTDLVYKTRYTVEGLPSPAENKSKLFLSYRKLDNKFGQRDRVANYILQAADCAVWFDAGLTPGENYDHEIDLAIRDCDAVVLLLSDHVLESDYIWDIELKHARQYGKGIIPIAIGFPPEQYPLINERLGHVHIIHATPLFSGELDTPEKKEQAETELILSIRRALARYITGRDIVKRVEAFFAAEKHRLPFRVLTLEQLYWFAYGMLNGIGTACVPEEAMRILDSLVHMYSPDTETTNLKGDILYDLMMYHLRLGQGAEGIACGEQAAALGCVKAANHLGQMHLEAEFTLRDYDKAMAMFRIGMERGDITATRLFLHAALAKGHGVGDRCTLLHKLLPYYEKAAAIGDTGDVVELLAAYWSTEHREALKQLAQAKELLEEPELAYLPQALLLYIKQEEFDSMSVVHTTVKEPALLGELMAKTVLDGRSFFLYKRRTDPEHSLVSFAAEDGRVLYEEDCYFGFGECPCFDIGTKDGFLFLQSTDFNHYSVDTVIATYCFINPHGTHVLRAVHYSDEMRGRITLPYSGFISDPLPT